MAVRPPRLTLLRGDITEQRVDAIVNAANSSLLGGGGVDGAIHRRGGREILAQCQALRASKYGGGLPTGQAVATTAGKLSARWVIHAVGPVFSAGEDRSHLLAECHRNSLLVADGLGAASIAFPAISTGVYRWPVDDAAIVALRTVSRIATNVAEVRFVLFDDRALAAFRQAADSLGVAVGLSWAAAQPEPESAAGASSPSGSVRPAPPSPASRARIFSTRSA